MPNWNARETSQIIVKAMGNIWQERFKLILDEPQVAFFDYRIQPVQSEEDDIYIYFAVARGHWWYTITTERPFDIDRKSLIFGYPIEELDLNEKGSSYRHYLFTDVLRPVVEKRLDSLDTNTFYVSSLFPLEQITTRDKL